jgi:L-alanine-DL-glutamate epimerase-like enolase superfamily enzyme
LTHCQIDGARAGGVNELFAIVAMAAGFGAWVSGLRRAESGWGG